MEKTVKNFDFGPRGLAESSIREDVRFVVFGSDNALQSMVADAGGQFVMTSEEWIVIQRYVEEALRLPTNNDQLKKLLGAGAPSDLSDFAKMLSVYKNVYNHAKEWKDKIYPASVSLSSDIYSYAQQATVYYKPILPLAKRLIVAPEDKDAREELDAILDLLARKARTYQQNAKKVADHITAFATELGKDKNALSDPVTGIVKYYKDKYGSTSAEIKGLFDQIEQQRAILKKANEEYDHDVTVAATTPAYGWVTIFGLIAAAIVAGIYGKKATDALNKIRAAESQIKSLEERIQASVNLLLALNNVQEGIKSIDHSVTKALPIVQKIQGVWCAIADDLEAIIKMIRDNIKEAVPILMKLGAESTIQAWEKVGEIANNYRLHAYITVK